MTTEKPATSPLDPLDTQMDGEPRFALLGRDPLAPGLVRLYADLREGKYEHCGPLLEAIIRKARARNPVPHKDSKHAWSARAIAGEMETFFMLNMRGEVPINRVNLADEREFPIAHPNDIKRAMPPREPDEGN